ncbi:MAG: TlyA family RNA methyltransferase [Oscillospiraceae bacterium]|nr:TlyA family RNA methyltransferase [Oscillospiraceae bacterium]
MRLDIRLTQLDLAPSREYARKLIKNENVSVNSVVRTKPAYDVGDSDIITVTGDVCPYVGRGGLKLEKAIILFDISLKGLTCLDIGASTGGFTDCMLKNGAAKVYALDVGHSQLHESLINDARVINMEKTNIRNAQKSMFDDAPDFISADVSFISLKLVLPQISDLLSDGRCAVVLVKPQFEAGKKGIGKNGIVTDRKVHIRVLREITEFAGQTGLATAGMCVSPVKGGSGNIEYLMYLKKSTKFDTETGYNINELVDTAFS